MSTLIDQLHEGDRFAALAGARLTEIREGFARAELVVGEQHVNAAGVCQGGVLYTLGDFSFAAVANSHGILSLGVSNTISFLKSAKLGDKLVAECNELYDHHKLPYCDIRITNQDGELVAVMTGLAYRMKKDFGFDSLM
ncbi:MAG: hotdog fold thioesterase [Bacteroidales bacterium]|nr:hotdog fold thioesterase [Bacteroidales bacterium]